MHESPDSGEWLAHAHQDLDNGYQALFFVPANLNIKIGPGDEASNGLKRECCACVVDCITVKLISEQFEINRQCTGDFLICHNTQTLITMNTIVHNTQTLKFITHIKQTVRHSLQPFSAACTNVKVLLITMNTIVQGMVSRVTGVTLI